MRRTVDLLRDLILIKSVSTSDMRRILSRVSFELKSIGLVPRVNRSLGVTWASYGRDGTLFNGHLDTVPLGEGWQRRQGELRGKRLYGRGACDMKAGCVAILEACRRLREERVPFSVLFTTDEETSMRGAKAIAKSRLVREAAAIVVAEPTGLDVIAAEKGVAWYAVHFKGKAAHGSTPHLGRNAIVDAAHFIREIETFAHPESPLDELTISMGRIEGGMRTNIVADRCRLELDVRHPAIMSPSAVSSLLKDKLSGLRAKARMELFHRVPPFSGEGNSEVVGRMLEITGGVKRTAPYATDLAFLSKGNPRGFVCGPGSAKQAHKPDEFVDVEEMTLAADAYERFAKAMSSLG